MKKVLATVAVSTALVMGGAVAASAAGIEMEGSVRVRGLSEQKTTQDSVVNNVYDQRVRLGMKAKPSDNLTGYILLESAHDASDSISWGHEDASTLFKGGDKFSNDFGILQAWMYYKPSDFGLMVGHMPIAPGTKQYINHDNSGDDAIVVTYDPNKNFHAHVATVKLAENAKNDNSDDLDAYALAITNKFSDNLKAGLNLIHLKGGAEADDTAAVATNAYNGMAITNLGVDASYKMSNLTLAGDVNLQFGTQRDDGTPGGEVDADGYAFQLSGDYKIGKSSVGVLFAQGSGRDEDKATENERNSKAFVTWLGDSAYQVYIPGYRKQIPGSFQSTLGMGDGHNGGLSNLTLVQLRANTSTTCPLTGKPFSVRGALSYMQTTEDVTPYTGSQKEDEIGTELDVVAAWKLTNNLTYKIEAAYLWTGDVFKTNATGPGSDPDDAYFLRHGITMKF